MQPQTPSHLTSAATVVARANASQLNAPPNERQLAQLQEAWLEHQVNPLLEIQWRGVPDSALHD